MSDNGVKPLPEQAVRDQHYVRRLWEQCRDLPLKRDRINAVREHVASGRYVTDAKVEVGLNEFLNDLEGIGEALSSAGAATRLLPDVVDRGDFTDRVNQQQAAEWDKNNEGDLGAEKKDEQVKFYVPSTLMEKCNAIFARQGVGLSEGMTRLVQLLVTAPDTLRPLLLNQVHGDAAKALALAILDDLGMVIVPFPRATYDRVAEYAKNHGHADVPAYILHLVTPTESVITGGPEDPADDRLKLSSPPPQAEHDGKAEGQSGKPKRGRQREPAQ